MPQNARLLTLVLASLLCQMARSGPPERGPLPHLVDLYGDPLPEGAVVRLGSVRMRHAGLVDFALLPDGTTAVTVGHDQMVRWWDLGTGRQTKAVRLPAESSYPSSLAISADGTTVAVQLSGQVTFYDAATGRQEQSFPVPDGFADCVVLSPDGSVVAVGLGGYRITLIERRSGKARTVQLVEAPEERGGYRRFLRASFSGDGRRLAVVGINGDKAVSVIEAATGREILAHPGDAREGALSPDGTRVAVSQFKEGEKGWRAVLKLYDVATGKETVWEPDGLEPDGFHVSFTPDGKAVACTGRRRGCLVDADTGLVLKPLPPFLGQVRYSPDGRRWAVDGWARLDVWDAATGRKLNDHPGHFGLGARTASPDGRLLAAEEYERIDLWDLRDGRSLRVFPLPDDPVHLDLTFLADRRSLVACQSLGLTRLWDVRTGAAATPVRLWGGDERWGPSYREFRLSPDGRRVAAVLPTDRDERRPCRLDVWDARTGQVIHRHTLSLQEWAKTEAWVPDGSAVAIRVKAGLTLIDPDTGAIGTQIPCGDHLRFSADGRLVATWEAEDNGRWGPGRREWGRVRVRELASGREVALVGTGGRVYGGLDFAESERAIVIADGRSLRVIDLVTGKDRGACRLPDVGLGRLGDWPVSGLWVLPGDRQALTTLEDGTALVWDLSAFPPPRLSEKHSEPELKAWWDELAGDDTGRAYAAGWKLTEAPPARVVPFLRERLKPNPVPDSKVVRRLIAELDSPTFSVREAAAKQLGQFGPAVVPAVQRASREIRSAEVRERLDKLLERLTDPVPPPESLRTVRAVAVLERVGTADARRVLEDLARGADAAPETKAARAALTRKSQSWGR
jgi:WD40 repeat protein